MGYAGRGAVRFLIVDGDGEGGAAPPPARTQWEGRNAIALPEATVRAINGRVVAEAPELVVHAMQELDEKLGVLYILILKDPVEGYELCLVSSETFDPSVRAATDYSTPDWGGRKEREAAALAAAAAEAEERQGAPARADELFRDEL